MSGVCVASRALARSVSLSLTAAFVLAASSTLAAADGEPVQVGFARADITPEYPVRLSGFGFRRAESEGVRQRIWAKAMAIGSDDQGPVVMLAVDSLGVPDAMVRQLASKLQARGVARDRVAVTATHTHSAPLLGGVLQTLFGEPIPPDHQAHIDRYTAELAANLEKVAIDALRNRQPARLFWGMGQVKFAVNRRTAGGPVDHDLPVLVAKDLEGNVRGIMVNYACHCVTLSDNLISGDWAGYAQATLEKMYPGAVALTAIGCGADANPSSGVTGDKADVAAQQGNEIAAEVQRLLETDLTPLTGSVETKLVSFKLPLSKLPTLDEWRERAKSPGAVGYHARVQLERLDRGEMLTSEIDYSVQTWTFGDDLAMVFLPGEVVVDYSLRLKRELNGRRLWINAYANDVPCYIPSERVLMEGGYEAEGAMIYYNLPARLAPGLEDKIIAAVHEQIGDRFKK